MPRNDNDASRRTFPSVLLFHRQIVLKVSCFFWGSPDAQIEPGQELGETQVEDLDFSVGSHVKPWNQDERNVVLMFGGPGTCKGNLSDLLVTEFGFHVISMERLMLRMGKELMAADKVKVRASENGNDRGRNDPAEPKLHGPDVDGFLAAKPSETCSTNDASTTDVVAYLSCKSTITLDGLLDKLIEQMEQIPARNFLIDLIPNHKGLVQSSIFKGSAKYLAMYDRSSLPVRFAILLQHVVPIDQSASCINTIASGQPMERPKRASKVDEGDPVAKQRRSIIVTCAAEPFIHLFEAAQRSIRIEVGNAPFDAIRGNVRQLMTTLNFPQVTSERQVFLALEGMGRPRAAGEVSARDLTLSVAPRGCTVPGTTTPVTLAGVIDALPRRVNDKGLLVVDFETADELSWEGLEGGTQRMMSLVPMQTLCISSSAVATTIFGTYAATITECCFRSGHGTVRIFLPKSISEDRRIAIYKRVWQRFHV